MTFPTLSDFDGNGRQALIHALQGSIWGSLEQALASLSVFAHPDAVAAVGHRAVFRAMRNMRMRRKIVEHHSYGRVLCDDNAAAEAAFVWSTNFARGRDLQCNHIYTAAADPLAFTDIRNICFTPSFLAKLSDVSKADATGGGYTPLLQYRAWELHRYSGPGACEPAKPEGYDQLTWAEPVGAGMTVDCVNLTFRQKLARKPRDGMTVSIREIGWTFSNYLPEPDFPGAGVASLE